MPKRNDQEKLVPPRTIVASTRLGWFQQRAAHTAVVVLAVALIAQGTERYLTVRDLGAQVYVVVTDREGVATQISRAHAEWQPEDGVWVNQATTWLRNVRARPLDPGTWVWQTGQVRATTERNLHGPVNQWMIASRREHRDRAVEVEILETTLVGTPQSDSASVNIRWRERARHQGATPGAWVEFAGVITLAKVPMTDAKEIAANPLGIVVLDYSFNPLTSARSS